MSEMGLHKLASLLVRDYTIMAKRHHDLAKDCTAMASTWRQVLASAQPNVLPSGHKENGVLGAPASSPQASWAFTDEVGAEIT